jgi:hypothetical protein
MKKPQRHEDVHSGHSDQMLPETEIMSVLFFSLSAMDNRPDQAMRLWKGAFD